MINEEPIEESTTLSFISLSSDLIHPDDAHHVNNHRGTINNNASDDDDSFMSEMSDFSWGTSKTNDDDDYIDDSKNETTTSCSSNINGCNNTDVMLCDDVDPPFRNNNVHSQTQNLCNNSDDETMLSFFTAQQGQQQKHSFETSRTTTSPPLPASVLLQRTPTPPSAIAEDLAREVEGLSIQEKNAINDDLFGNNCLCSNEVLDGNLSEAQGAVFSALIEDFYHELEKIIAQERYKQNSTTPLVYTEALMKCPKIVDTESNPLRFLRYHDYDSKSAAYRLIQYWEMRKEIFGEDKAFLPMTLDGAMEDEVETIMMFPTIFRLLPEDSKGRTVICLDKEGVDAKGFPALKLARYIWYGIHMALLKESTQIKGVVYVINIPSFSLYEYDPYRAKLVTTSFANCLPIKVRSLHFSINNSLFLTCMIPIYTFFLCSSIRRRIQIHYGSREEILSSLGVYGLHRYGLPISMGGTYRKMPLWVEECRQRKMQKEANTAWVIHHP